MTPASNTTKIQFGQFIVLVKVKDRRHGEAFGGNTTLISVTVKFCCAQKNLFQTYNKNLAPLKRILPSKIMKPRYETSLRCWIRSGKGVYETTLSFPHLSFFNLKSGKIETWLIKVALQIKNMRIRKECSLNFSGLQKTKAFNSELFKRLSNYCIRRYENAGLVS